MNPSVDQKHLSRQTDLLAKTMQQIIRVIRYSVSRIDFIEKASAILIDNLDCDFIEIRVREMQKFYKCRTLKNGSKKFESETLPYEVSDEQSRIPAANDGSLIETLCRIVFLQQGLENNKFYTPNGAFICNDTSEACFVYRRENEECKVDLSPMKEFGSFAILRLSLDNRDLGLMCIGCKETNSFSDVAINQLEVAADVMASAMAHQRAMVALRERVKELSCIYKINSVLLTPENTLEEILDKAVEFIAPAWRYPDIASCRVVIDGKSYFSKNYASGPNSLSSEVIVNNEPRGFVEVIYAKKKPERDEGPFLDEERKLIDVIAQQIAFVISEKEAEMARIHLEEQLHHADRLATLGQLASGVAHEINEPLASVLGFSQLILKDENLAQEHRKDLERIKGASLHAREIVRKLLVFGRQMPSEKTEIQANAVVENALSMLEGHLEKANVELDLQLDANLCPVFADPSQLTQAVVNLVVNALQAMPDGGQLKVETRCEANGVLLAVQDSGIGMSEETRKKAFVPFYSTKDVNKGTGLGLPVVLGIVKAHSGEIQLTSKQGQGTRFEIRLPKID